MEDHRKLGCTTGCRIVIPNAYLIEWRGHVPWKTSDMVEQDLMISRAICDIFGQPELGRMLAFRGGTALHKLFLETPRRYSEDIDLVQVEAGPIGPIFDALRDVLSPWLGDPARKTGPGVATLAYRVGAESDPARRLRLKVEINTREHFTVLGMTSKAFAVQSRWHSADCSVLTYAPADIMATKLRALYQRRKGRDLFDLWLGLNDELGEPRVIVETFQRYMENEGSAVTANAFAENLEAKLANPSFLGDVAPLVPVNVEYDVRAAADQVHEELLSLL